MVRVSGSDKDTRRAFRTVVAGAEAVRCWCRCRRWGWGKVQRGIVGVVGHGGCRRGEVKGEGEGERGKGGIRDADGGYSRVRCVVG